MSSKDEISESNEEIIDLSLEISVLIQEMKKGISEIENMPTVSEKQSKIEYLKGRHTRLKELFQSFKVELYYLSEEEREPYQKKLTEFSREINEFLKALEWAQERSELLGVHNIQEQKRNLDFLNSDQVLTICEGKMHETDEVLTEIGRIVNQTQEVGSSTLHRLGEQNEQIYRAKEDMSEMSWIVEEASKLVFTSTKTLVTDKLFAFFLCLIILLVLFIIFYNAVGTRGGSSSSAPS